MNAIKTDRPTIRHTGAAINNTPSVALLKVSFCKDADGNDIVFDGGMFELLL